MKIKISLFVGLLILFTLSSEIVRGQGHDNFRSKSSKEVDIPGFFWGGSLWLGFGTYTFVDVSATFGTQLTERLALGLSGKYSYYNDRRSISGDFKTSVYGGSIYSQFAVVKDFRNLFKVKSKSGIIAHVEYELMNTKYNYIYFDNPDSDRDRYWLQTILVGGGYVQHLGERAKSFIVLLWNVAESADNPYTYPQFRIGFTVAI